MANTLYEKLLRGQQPIGTFTGLCSAAVVECLGRTGLDFVIIDNEHSPADALTSAELVRAAENAGLCPLARVRECSRSAVLKLLDVGAKGLIIPNITTVDEVRQLISWGKFPPLGQRGFCPTRKDGWGFDDDGTVAQRMAQCNGDTLLIPQCETAEALACVEDIAALDGVDGLFIGPFDLSIALGLPGQFDHPTVQAAFRRIREACHQHNKFCLLFAGSEQAVAEGFRDGFDGMTFGIDTLLLIGSVRSRVADIRQILSGNKPSK